MSALPPIDACFAAFGEETAAVVTVPDGSPVNATIVWLPSRNSDLAVGNAGVFDTMPTASFKTSQVPRVPKGTRVVCPPMGGGTTRVWIVREVYEVDAEVVIVGLA